MFFFHFWLFVPSNWEIDEGIEIRLGNYLRFTSENVQTIVVIIHSTKAKADTYSGRAQ